GQRRADANAIADCGWVAGCCVTQSAHRRRPGPSIRNPQSAIRNALEERQMAIFKRKRLSYPADRQEGQTTQPQPNAEGANGMAQAPGNGEAPAPAAPKRGLPVVDGAPAKRSLPMAGTATPPRTLPMANGAPGPAPGGTAPGA